MIRKTIVALAAAAALGTVTLAPTVASARPWNGHGVHHPRHHGHQGHHPHFRAFRFRGPVFASCWRWVPTRFGYAKVWVCG
jgi:hypothetical protein